MSLTLHNASGRRARFIVRLGELPVAYTRPLEPEESLRVELDTPYHIAASSRSKGQLIGTENYPLGLQGRVTARLAPSDDPEYDHLILGQEPASHDGLTLHNQCGSPVLFHIDREHGAGLSVLVQDAVLALQVGSSLSVTVIVKGITLPAVNVHPFASITVENTHPESARGFFRVQVR